MEHAEELDGIIARWVASLDLDGATEALVAADIPTGPVYSIADIVADPQMRARAATTVIPDENGIDVATYGIVPRMRNNPGTLDHAARAVGRDQDAVARTFGLTKEEAKR
jgi:formyl-CoA transferase